MAQQNNKPKGYDPTQIKVYAGNVRMVDFGEDTMVKITRTKPLRSMTVGAVGNVTVNKSADHTGKAEITLMNNSASNDILKGLALLDDGFPFAVVDMNRAGDLGSSTLYAYVENMPDFERAAEVGECTWSILLADVDFVLQALANVASVI